MAIRQMLIVIQIWLFNSIIYGQIISPDNQARLLFDEIENPYKGQLETIVDTDVGPIWTPVCFGNFGEKEAKVACKSFGFLDFDTFFTNYKRLETVNHTVTYTVNHTVMYTANYTVMYTVNQTVVYTVNHTVMYDCRGYESALSECIATEQTVHCCNDTQLICTALPLDSNYLRINPKDEVHKGRLQINYNGNWGPVYNEHWNLKDSKVACRQLGFIGVMHHNQPTTDRNYSTVPVADGFRCGGQEKFLHKCDHGDWQTSVSNSSSDVFLTCIPIYEWNNNITFRLADGGYPFQGRLEFKYNTADKWGTVCNDIVSIDTGHFICAQLGLGFIQGAAKITKDAIFGAGTGDIVLSNFHCAISDGNIKNCEYAKQVSKYCDHSTDLSIKCVPITEEAKPEMTIKLTGSERRYEGLVRLSYSDGSEFGTICSNGFNLVVADVICRELNFYRGAYSFSVGEYYVDEDIIIMLNNISCTGNESRLIDCKYDFVDGCTHAQDVSVVCIPLTEDSFVTFLFGKFGLYEGMVSVYDGEEFNQVCPDHWGQSESEVVCNELDHRAVLYYDTKPQQDLMITYKNPIFNFKCNGTENSLLDCEIVYNNTARLCSSRDYVVRVECIRYLPDFFNTSANTSELFYNIDYFLTEADVSGNLSSASFGYFVIDSPAINATSQLELPNSVPLTYSFYAHHNTFSKYLSSSSYLMSLDLAKINATGRLPFLDESSYVHLYPFGEIFGLNVHSPQGEYVDAKASFIYPANLSVPFQIDVPLDSTIDLICTYFDPVMEYWSSAGLITTVLPNDRIKCESEHTTSFSIMMKVTIHEEGNRPTWDTILSAMTYLCLGLSISAAIPTFIIFVSVRALQNRPRFIIVRNIVLCVCLRDILFLFLIWVSNRENKPRYLCEASGALLHYINTCAFLWMICSSTDLWLKVNFPYINHTENVRYYRPLSYIVPLLIVGATIGGFRDEYVGKSCWLSVPSGSIWVFYSTVILIIALISVQLTMVAWKTSKMLKSSVQTTDMQINTKRSRSVANSFIPLVAVFGVTWIIGVFVAIQGTPVFDLIFVVVNGLQGFVIFLSQFLCSKQVRIALKEHKVRVSTRTF